MAEHSRALEDLNRRALADGDGRSYLDARRAMTPRWGVVWAQLATVHLLLLATMVVVVRLDPGWRWSALPIGTVGGLVIGYVLHHLVLFQHEAAHFNLAPTRRANDLLANVVICSLIGESMAAYRPVHLDHHRYLGTMQDTERSYFDALDMRFVLEGLSGVRLLRTAIRRSRVRSAAKMNSDSVGFLLIAALINGTIVLGLLWTGHPAAALAWTSGLVVFLPFLIALRQLLEHRSDDADRTVDYSQVDQGAVTRMFGTGPLASTFGGVGFNRHLLHHWDPGVSYTRLADLERFLLDTEASDIVMRNAATYAATARTLAGR